MSNRRWSQLREYLAEILQDYLSQPDDPAQNPAPRFLIDLMPANGNLGEGLLARGVMPNVRRYLDAAALVDAPGVGVQIQYPLFDEGMVGALAEDFIEFYCDVAHEIRQRGLVFYAETSPLFSGTRFSDVPVSYAGMSPESYVQQRAKMAQIIIEQIKPDYLSFVHEVSTERILTGLDVTDAMLVTALAELSFWSGAETKVGGGLPAWADGKPDWMGEPVELRELMRRYAQAGDFYNAHFYPAQTALSPRSNSELYQLQWMLGSLPPGTEIVVGETWLYKAMAWELAGGDPMARADKIYARDAFEFWDDLDALFLQAIHRLARVAGIRYINLFWSRHLFAYQTEGRTVDEKALNRKVMDAIATGALTRTGEMCRQLNG